MAAESWVCLCWLYEGQLEEGKSLQLLLWQDWWTHMGSGLCLTRAQLQGASTCRRHVDYVNLRAGLPLAAGPSPHGTDCGWATDRCGMYCEGWVSVSVNRSESEGMKVEFV